MSVLVSVDTELGLLSRYECGGQDARLTHQFQAGAPLPSMSPALIEQFRTRPEMEDYVGPPIRPTDPGSSAPPAAANGALLQVAA